MLIPTQCHTFFIFVTNLLNVSFNKAKQNINNNIKQYNVFLLIFRTKKFEVHRLDHQGFPLIGQFVPALRQ